MKIKINKRLNISVNKLKNNINKISINTILKNILNTIQKAINKLKIHSKHISNETNNHNYEKEMLEFEKCLKKYYNNLEKTVITNDSHVKRRKQLKKEKCNSFKMMKPYYFILSGMLVILSFSMYFNYNGYNNLNNENYIQMQQGIEAINSNNFQEESVNNSDTRNDEKTESKEIKSSDYIEKQVNIGPVTIANKPELDFIMPLNNEIVKEYSTNELLYSITLDEWRTHDGIDIKGNMGESVISSESGIIKKIYADSLYGNTVVISHEDEYTTVYSNVVSNLKEGEKITKGSVVGTLDNSAIIESLDEPHLHFMMLHKDVVIDPLSKI